MSNVLLKMAKTFRLMNAAHLTSRFEQIEEDNAWDELFYKINLRSDEQEKQLGLSFDVSTSFENAEKNRYRNVLPYDQNRVILKRAADADSSNYINASPLKIPSANRNYILSQGPLPNTASDFWQMVHEQNAEIVIMLSKIMEKNFIKCHSYFPHKDNQIERYNGWELELLSEEVKPHYVLRRIRFTLVDPVAKAEENTTANIDKDKTAEDLSSADSTATMPLAPEKSETSTSTTENNMETNTLSGKKETSRIIHHFQYMTWPDFGVPEHTDHFLEFLTHIRDLQTRLKENRPKAALIGNNIEELKSKDRLSTSPAVEGVIDVQSGGDCNTDDTGGRPSGGGNGMNANSEKTEAANEDGDVNPPLVCHCSAGIGRTGAFVVIDTVLSVLERNGRQLEGDTCSNMAEEESAVFVNNGERTEESKLENNNGGETSADVVSSKAEADVEKETKPSEPSLTAQTVKETEREKDEEDLSVAQKKKMRSEEAEKPLSTNFKLICTPVQKQQSINKQTKATADAGNNNGKPNVEQISSSSDDFEDLETLCDLVVFIRKHRMGLIQTPQQLRFCWKAIIDWIGSNNNKFASRASTMTDAQRTIHPSTPQESSTLRSRREKVEQMRNRLQGVERQRDTFFGRVILRTGGPLRLGVIVTVMGATVCAMFAYYQYQYAIPTQFDAINTNPFDTRTDL